MNDVLKLDFLMGTFSGTFLAMAILRCMEQSEPGSTADCPFTPATIMVSGAFGWLTEVFFGRKK
jgi:hypothetical protein